MSELAKEKIYKKELEKVGGEGNNNLERIRSLAGAGALEDIKDKNGNLRFVEGDLTTASLEGETYLYNKWSLSGTHLMLVLVITNTTETDINFSGKTLATANLPNYITNKIVSLENNLVIKQRFTDLTMNYNFNAQLEKNSNQISIYTPSATAKSGAVFRLQFDLLIDAE